MSADRDLLHRLLSQGDGVLRCDPAWVARDFLPPGRRLGLPEEAYDVGPRGAICERWLASETKADNRVGPDDEGLSHVVGEHGERMLLRDAVAADPAAVMGSAYAAGHRGLGRLAKIFDYGFRLPYHIHPPQEFASLVGRNAKDESYHFLPGVDPGAHPETFFGVHPWIAEEGAHEVLLPYLVDWDSDLVLRHARAELQVPGEGFHVPSGVLHAPGTALTLELQEDSDVLAMFQALNAGRIISKDLLFKDVRPQDREAEGGAVPAAVRRLGAQRRPVVLREPAPDAAAGDRRRLRCGVVDLLQHRQVRREAAGGAARRDAPAPGAGGLQRLRLVGRGHVRRPRGQRWRARARRAGRDPRRRDRRPRGRQHRQRGPGGLHVLRSRPPDRRADDPGPRPLTDRPPGRGQERRARGPRSVRGVSAACRASRAACASARAGTRG
ncbi:hypothetical protein [Nocardioides sp. TF02-7]|uniref:hypothetical protein n=1 Tax=Nocardioides sp. TF02-7 TaxID=2917724 RepID=UPI001F0611CC|nr:hypothetical protein [Nocardioides sp. TF02-7]UMG91567.1 hypothetical protein MF408_15855 [Nocardioides sp. TF02-7]